jgi:uracil-DNA glycosylase family 4
VLEKLLASVGWKRQEVFIANVVKCRPPDNRDPEPDEIAACSPFLSRQLEALDPALVVTLGRFSMGRFNPGARIGQVHGTFQPAPAGLGADRALVYFMYHPAAALRDPSVEATSFRDMAGVPVALLEARARRAAASAAAERAIVQPNDTPAASSIAEPEAEPVTEPGADVADDAITSVASGLERDSADPSDQLGLF